MVPPPGLRPALNHPERIAALITQMETPMSRDSVVAGHLAPRPLGESRHRKTGNASEVFIFTPMRLHAGAVHGSASRMLTSGILRPEAIALDQAPPDRPQSAEIQLDLITSHQTNIALPSEVSGIFPHASTSHSRGVGKERPVLPTGTRCEALWRDNPAAKSCSSSTRDILALE